MLNDLNQHQNTPQFRHQFSHDFDEQATFLNGWNQDYAQISAGCFEGFISEAHFSGVSLFWEYTNQALYQQGLLNIETIAIGVPLSLGCNGLDITSSSVSSETNAGINKLAHKNSSEDGLFCGTVCNQNTIHIFSGTGGFEFISPNQLMIGLIVVSRAQLLKLLTAEDQHLLNAQCQQARVMQIPSKIYQHLIAFLNTSFGLLKSQPQLMQHAYFNQNMANQATELVIESLLAKQINLPATAPHKSWQVFCNTRDIVNVRQDKPLSIAELCTSLNMSRRSLQYHFKQTLHTSPAAYLRAERLNGVRHLLKTANSVTEAATHWGFWHFGHFSQEYKKMFGELPSATFKRLHQLN